MGKSTLVIDTPDTCELCPLCHTYNRYSTVECAAFYKPREMTYKEYQYHKPEWCPLKEVSDE